MSAGDSAMDLPELGAAREFLERGDEFVVTSHIDSDGDGVGGCLALRNLCRSAGKKATVLLQDLPDSYDFVEGWDEIKQVEGPPATKAPFAVLLDCPRLDRIGRVQEYLDENTRILNIDHHHDNERFGAIDLVSPQASSSSELVYHLAAHTGTPIDAATASLLYMGILFDTGGFRYSLTTPTTLEVAAELVRCGARLDYIADQLFGNKSFDSVKLIGKAVNSCVLHGDGRVAVLHLSHEDLQAGDPEEVVNYGLLIKGVEVSLLLKEQEPSKYRISLRARDQVDVSLIARAFDGGGHRKASGCRIPGSREHVERELLAEVAKHLS